MSSTVMFVGIKSSFLLLSNLTSLFSSPAHSSKILLKTSNLTFSFMSHALITSSLTKPVKATIQLEITLSSLSSIFTYATLMPEFSISKAFSLLIFSPSLARSSPVNGLTSALESV